MGIVRVRTEQVIDVSDWDNLVESTYGRPYNFQQQDGCKERGKAYLTVSLEEPDDFENDEVPEIVNHNDMGVSFKAWIERDPKQPLASDKGYNYGRQLWWERNFYPTVESIAHDLCKRGLIDAGEYVIDIDW